MNHLSSSANTWKMDSQSLFARSAMHLLLGVPYGIVLRNSLVCARMCRLWIAPFNERGIDGLIYEPRAGRPRKIPPERVACEILPLVDDPPSAGQTHWTALGTGRSPAIFGVKLPVFEACH